MSKLIKAGVLAAVLALFACTTPGESVSEQAASLASEQPREAQLAPELQGARPAQLTTTAGAKTENRTETRNRTETETKTETETDQKPPVSPAVENWCKALVTEMKTFRWQLEGCRYKGWKVGGSSVKQRPLVYAEFGDPNSKNTTLVLAMVHGDEITPLYLALSLVNWMAENESSLPQSHVVIAPLVNPDGFFRNPRTRMNARGVDVNRNFATRDWQDRALQAWKTKFGSDPRRFPGSASGSEPETVFQDELIRKMKPQKILSIHAPLNFMDYDGPTASGLSLKRFPAEYVKRCLQLRQDLRAKSGGFFPGSLGNFSGQEMGIPTLTLELPTADSRRAYRYWLMFRKGIRSMIEFVVPANATDS